MPGNAPTRPDTADQEIARKEQFENDHPQVVIGQYGADFWQAEIPPGSVPGEHMVTFTTGTSLGELMDKLDALFSDSSQPPAPGVRDAPGEESQLPGR